MTRILKTIILLIPPLFTGSMNRTVATVGYVTV